MRQNKDREYDMEEKRTVQAIVSQQPSSTDPNGSYTGKPVDRSEKPIQDADDL